MPFLFFRWAEIGLESSVSFAESPAMVTPQNNWYPIQFPLLLILLGGFLLTEVKASVDVATPPSFDFSVAPDYQAIASVARSGGLPELRNSLGNALAAAWKPSLSGVRGSCSQENFAKWVDLYQWIDLLESDEASVTKRWLSRHLIAEVGTTGTPANPLPSPNLVTQGTPFQKEHPQKVTILKPGSPLVRRYDDLQHRVTEQISSDPVMLGKVLAGLVTQPFAPANGPLAARLEPDFIAAMVSDPKFLALWSRSFSEDDFAPRVLMNLQSIWKSNPGDWREFLTLAMAISVVMDQPAPDFWPHHQVQQRDVPRVRIKPEELFAEWITAFRAGKLLRDLRLLGVDELKYVVDAPLDPSEFNFVRNAPVLSHQDPQKAFNSISYDQGRVIKNMYMWPWGSYELARIKKTGGICVDQAYYASVLGKALAIPTIFFAGLGKDGGHAWVGFLKGPDNWDFSVGRYEGQNFTTGEALDPQSWTPITDHGLDQLTRHRGNRDSQDAARRDLVMAWNFRRRGDADGEGRAIKSAVATCPDNPDLWDAREDWLVRTASPASELKSHHESAIRQFSGYRDLKAQHQEALVRMALVSGNQSEAKQLSQQIVHENKGGFGARTDLSATAAWDLIGPLLKSANPDEALREYDRQVMLQGANGGSDFFYKVVRPLADYLIVKGRPDLARLVIKKAFDRLKPIKGSLVDNDLRKLWSEAGGTR